MRRTTLCWLALATVIAACGGTVDSEGEGDGGEAGTTVTGTGSGTHTGTGSGTHTTTTSTGGSSTGGSTSTGGTGGVGGCEEPSNPPPNCDAVNYFQCGFYAYCEGTTIVAEWHEHVMCGEVEDIYNYSCTFECESICDDSMVEWPADGQELVTTMCLAVDSS